VADDSNSTSVDFAPGKLRSTGNPFDLAISGQGFFVVRSAAETYYTRNGQFDRDSDGRLVAPGGMALQSTAGDVVVGSSNVTVLQDGTVLEGGEPIARLSIANVADPKTLRPVGGGLFAAATAPEEVAGPVVRQGMLETSNVSAADEMISIMAALRNAQSGQQMIQVYDELADRAASAFGQTS
jgi:flagellar basal-body rod protein FlgF